MIAYAGTLNWGAAGDIVVTGIPFAPTAIIFLPTRGTVGSWTTYGMAALGVAVSNTQQWVVYVETNATNGATAYSGDTTKCMSSPLGGYTASLANMTADGFRLTRTGGANLQTGYLALGDCSAYAGTYAANGGDYSVNIGFRPKVLFGATPYQVASTYRLDTGACGTPNTHWCHTYQYDATSGSSQSSVTYYQANGQITVSAFNATSFSLHQAGASGLTQYYLALGGSISGTTGTEDIQNGPTTISVPTLPKAILFSHDDKLSGSPGVLRFGFNAGANNYGHQVQAVNGSPYARQLVQFNGIPCEPYSNTGQIQVTGTTGSSFSISHPNLAGSYPLQYLSLGEALAGATYYAFFE